MSSAEHPVILAMAGCKCDPEESCPHRRVAELNLIAVQYYHRLVRFFQRRSSSSEDAADLAQDTFARLSATDLEKVREPAAFLFTTALNLLRDQARSARMRHAALAVPVDEHQLICPAPHVEHVLDGERRIRSLESALLELSPKCRAVFVLFHFDALSHREIADRLSISVSMVEKYVRQATSHCRYRLDELSEETHDNGGRAI